MESQTARARRLDDLLQDARKRIEAIDAEFLLVHVLRKPRSWLFAHRDDLAPDEAAAAFRALVSRRAAGEPVAYLTGQRGFWRFDLAVSPATLIPRPETELLVELALERLAGDRPLRIADLGTGSGAIGLALAFERPLAQVVATDASAAALDVARANAAALQLRNVEFREGDWFAPLAGERFDLIASNPPYVALGDPHLDEGDLRFEPASALSSGADGFDALRAITSRAPAHLGEDGWLLVEHGWDQGATVRDLFAAVGFIEVETARDLEGRDRVTLGCWPG
ncbi:peptide chain release factor N(5)-glutamine methyltransferase [Lysobacter sp. Root494]|uniref:peptide chain release factor N(5)-glutamine methyltransferase n=1 Tax=Lysobacter sp. Root494 TaxID=1736549 RepID=UPI0006FA2105|nr:peptide chain release factor N(5)-glutamine methyltransferase [Lysobacter sp. Root494]KQY55255.1 protein-(glutamine-N5) methyltransferase, release factor-specific [Lysobacter sp. Root494]